MSEFSERLDAIEQRANASTAGPWFVAGEWIGGYYDNSSCGGCSGILSPSHEPSCGVEQVGRYEGGAEDREFIAACRTEVPWLVGRIKIALAVMRDAEPEQVETVGPHSPNCHQYHVRCLVTMLRRALGEVSS